MTGGGRITTAVGEQELARLQALPFEQRLELAHALGLVIACCDDCGCYLTAPYCHPAEQATSAWQSCPCPQKDDEDGNPLDSRGG